MSKVRFRWRKNPSEIQTKNTKFVSYTLTISVEELDEYTERVFNDVRPQLINREDLQKAAMQVIRGE